MSIKDNGGAAFPELKALYKETASKHTAVTQGGMTLRDYFAAKFMQGFIAAPDCEENYSHVTKADCAKRAYEMADAMLAERAK